MDNKIYNKIKESYDTYLECDFYAIDEPVLERKMNWLLQVFDLFTYDSGLDVKIGNKLLQWAKVIADKENFDYTHTEQYEEMITYFLLLGSKLDWGTSIRGAWFSGKIISLPYTGEKIALDNEVAKLIVNFIEELK